VKRLARAPALALLALFVASPADGAGKKKPGPTPTATPTPLPLLRAAGSCLEYVPGRHVILAEVGTEGRVFAIDPSTRVETAVRTGARIRILYVETPAGPLARRILPGPAVATPTPSPAPPKSP
jgi:hypothetical protein